MRLRGAIGGLSSEALDDDAAAICPVVNCCIT